MWRAVNEDGTLTYSFVESLKATYPYYGLRLIGGSLFFIGMLIMAYNVWKTISAQEPADVEVLDPVSSSPPQPPEGPNNASRNHRKKP